MFRRRYGVTVACITFWALPAVAWAHPVIDRGIGAYEGADFEAALGAFTLAEGRTDLKTDDLLTLLEMRALVFHALGEEARMRRDLRQLASIRPTHKLGRLAPPPVRTAFDDVRAEIAGGITIDLTSQSSPGKLELVASVKRDVAGLGREIRIYARVDGGPWQLTVGDRAVVRVHSKARVEYHATLIGPGGATVTQTGSAQEPRVANVAAPKERRVPVESLALWSGAGAAFVATAIVAPLARKKDRDLNNGCGATTPPSCTRTDLNEVRRYARATDGLWISGAALAVTGTVLFFVKRKKKTERATEPPQVTPMGLTLTPWGTKHAVGGTARLRF